MAFHAKCGECITLSNNNYTAARNITEFNHGLVLSAEPLKDDVLFEVRIDKKVNSWCGSIDIGVTASNPETLEFPACATKLRNGSWIMSGESVLKDGIFVAEFYGKDLEKLYEGNTVGVMRTSQSELIFYINGESQGPAAFNIPQVVYAVIDLFGKCVQVTYMKSTNTRPEHNNDSSVYLSTPLTVTNTVCPTAVLCSNSTDRLRFHQRCGSMIRLSDNARKAERRRPLDEFNNGVVMTHRPLRDNELFEIRIDRLIDKWSGSIEVGVTTHNPEALQFPATMTNMRSGTIMMSGSGILTNGKGTRREYGDFNLDELRVGDRVGMIRHSNGNLHYYINGLDQGVAAVRVAPQLWGVIDLYGMTIKVTIVDRDEREQQNLVTRRSMLNSINSNSGDYANSGIETWSTNDSDRLLFHPICGMHAEVINNGRSVHRPNANDDFNNGVVLTQRPLRLNEFFEVRLEKIITKWAGSIEIGVTTHAPSELDFPFTMTNVRTGTWMMTGNGIMHNGNTIIESYGQNLDRLQVGDRVGVIRRDGGILHFYVNGVDQGPAATDVPECIYGVVDLYGQAYQASIVYSSDLCSPDTVNSSISNITLYSDLRFNTVHGRNAQILSNGLTACRPRAHAEFNDAIVFSNRPLRDGEMFEVTLDTLVERWCGSVEIGLTAVRPEDISLPTTATDLEQDTVMLSGSIIMENGCNVRNGYSIDLDTLRAGARIGVKRNQSGFVHFYLDSVDQGMACKIRADNLYAVVDLYGMCTQISIVQNEARAPYAISENSASLQATSVIQPNIQVDVYHRFANVFSRNMNISDSGTIAKRKELILGLKHCLVFSSTPLAYNESFEVKVLNYVSHLAGSIKIGITDLNIESESVRNNVPGLIKDIPSSTWYATGNDIHYNDNLIGNFTPSLHWLRTGDRVALELTSTRSVKLLINSDEIGILFKQIPELVWVVIELSGSVSAVQITSLQGPKSPLRPCVLRLQDSLDFTMDHVNKHDSMLESLEVDNPNFEFCDHFGKNIKLNACKKIARRIRSYNNGIIFTNKPLIRGQQIMIRIDSLKENWSGSIVVGILSMNLEQIKCLPLPSTAFAMNGPIWVVASDYLCVQGTKIKSKYGRALSNIKVGTVITLSLSNSGSFSIMVGNSDLGAMATDLPQQGFPIIDVYGSCEKVSIVTSNSERLDQSLEIDDIDTFSHPRQNQVTDDILTENLITIEPSTSLQEKADLELHEKESNSTYYASELDLMPSTSGVVTGSMCDIDNFDDNVSQNFLKNLEIQNASKPCMTTSENENINIEIQRMESSYNEYIDINHPVYSHNHVENLNIQSRTSMDGISEYMQDNLLIQHNTNINIQRSQSSHNIKSNEKNNLSYMNPPDSLNITSNYNDNICNEVSNAISMPSSSINLTHIEESPTRVRDCPYMQSVIDFKNSLVLPEAFFSSDHPKCYCNSCCNINNRYRGWIRFKLKHKSTSCTDWRLAFYDTKVDRIRAVLDLGQPLPTTNDIHVFSEKGVTTGNKLILRENLDVMPRNTHDISVNNSVYSVSTVFEVKVRPGSISSCTSTEQDLVTKEAGACVLDALLMKVVIS